MRGVLARVEQELALVAQSQRESDRQLQSLEQRQERLDQELRGLNAPDPASVERLAGDSAAIEEQLEEAQAQLLEQEDRLPGLDEQRRQAQAHAQEESQAVSRLDARLAALSKLQDEARKSTRLNSSH